MGRITNLLSSCFLLTAMMTCALLAGNGKLSGRILDAQTGKPIIGNIQLVGTMYGSSADSSGRYFILEIPPRTYDIKCSAVGYRAHVLAGLVVAPDRSQSQDFSLAPEDVDLGEIIVQADRMAVQSSQTSARTDFDGTEFRALPLNSTMDLIALSPGTYKQFVGGLPPVFSRTTIDGIDVTDENAMWYAEATGVSPSRVNSGRDVTTAQHTSFAEPNVNAVEQATLVTGTAGSNYAGAAGTLLYTLREGRGAWGGEAMVRVSQLGGLRYLGPDIYWDAHEYFTERATLAASEYPTARQTANYYTWFPGKYPCRSRPDVTASLALGGSIAEGMGLHMTGRFHSTSNRLPNEKMQRFNGSSKFTWSLSPSMRLQLVGLLEDRGRLFGWKNSSYSDSYRYFLEGVPLWDGLHLMGGVKWSHFLSQTTSYEIQISVVHDNVRRGFCDDNNDGVVSPGEDGGYLTWSDTAEVRRYMAPGGNDDLDRFFSAYYTTFGMLSGQTKLLTSYLAWHIARPPIYYENSTSRVVSLKGDMSSQVDVHHLLAAGVQLRLHTVERELRTGAYQLEVPYGSYIQEVWAHHPVNFDLYVQDRMEFSGLVMNVGLRIEGERLDVSPVIDWFAPPDTAADQQGVPVLVPARGSPLPWKWFFSPRVAFSHPVGHSAAIHASFSRSRLASPYSFIYANYNTSWYDRKFISMINVDQEPTSAMNYDLGVQWALAPATLLLVNAYYRDFTNLGTAAFQVVLRSAQQYYVLTNSLFGDSRGIEVTMQRDLTPLAFGISAGGRIAYAYSRFNGPQLTRTADEIKFSAATGYDVEYEGRLPFGEVATWDKSYREIIGGRSTLIAGFNRTDRVTCAFTIGFPGDIRLSGTGSFSSGFWYPEILKADRTIPYARAPWNRRIDLRLEKRFSIETRLYLDCFVDIFNVCNWVNVLAYHDYLQTARNAWETQGDPTGGSGVNRPVTPEGTLIYDIPREVYFGVRFGF